ncbi:hypothetical protein OUZ56_022053 [Daphnia magna]|uniref:Uncharacterized protein n=1 Tax=Daphnia magna TaxID=35525 RepID=A0ABR0AVD5_9CRUS|nr:hypothetical protein OUZ56_022053 [Daphnia magna]
MQTLPVRHAGNVPCIHAVSITRNYLVIDEFCIVINKWKINFRSFTESCDSESVRFMGYTVQRNTFMFNKARLTRKPILFLKSAFNSEYTILLKIHDFESKLNEDPEKQVYFLLGLVVFEKEVEYGRINVVFSTATLN